MGKPQLQSAGETSETSMLAVSGGTQTDSCDCTNCVQNGGLKTASIVANPATHNITADECFQKCKDNTGQNSGQTCAFALYDDALPLMGCNHIYDNEHGNHSRQGEQVEDAKNRCHDANGKTTNGMMWTFPGGIDANGNAFAEYNWTFRTTQKCWFYPEVPKKVEAAINTNSIVSVIIDNDCVEETVPGSEKSECDKMSNSPFAEADIPKPNSISIGKEGRCACGDPVASCGTPLTTCSQDSDCNNIQCSGHKWCLGIEGAIDDEARGGERGKGVQWQQKCPAPESYPVKWDHVNGAAIPTSALTAGGARRGTFTIKSISNNKVTLSDDTVFTMPEKVDSQHPDAFGTGGASQYKCWKRS